MTMSGLDLFIIILKRLTKTVKYKRQLIGIFQISIGLNIKMTTKANVVDCIEQILKILIHHKNDSMLLPCQVHQQVNYFNYICKFIEANKATDIRQSMQFLQTDDASIKKFNGLTSFKDMLSDETGQEALCLSQKFNKVVQIIKQHLEDTSHPVYQIIIKFDEIFFKQYQYITTKELDTTFASEYKQPEQSLQIINEIHQFVKIIFLSILKFYRIELKPNDLKKDLLINLITSIIMQNRTYAIVMNAILQDNISRIRKMQQNMQKYKFRVNLEQLGVSKYFQFSNSFRKLLQSGEEIERRSSINPNDDLASLDINQLTALKHQQRSITLDQNVIKRQSNYSDKNKPFDKTIEAIKEIPKLTSPMRKLVFIYQIFNTLMIEEIDQFWDNIEVDKKKLSIDYENLNGIAIYIALKAALPVLIVDIIFIENFVSKAIMFTNRAYNMTVLHSALLFIEENLPNYCEAKEKRNPLKENLTPQFIGVDNLMQLSPRSQNQHSVLMSKLLDNSGFQFSDHGKKETQENQGQLKESLENADDMLFELEQQYLDIKKFQSKQLDSRISSQNERLDTQSQQDSNKIFIENEVLETDDNLSGRNMSCQSKSNILPDAAKKIHQIISERLYQKQTMPNGFQNKSQQHQNSTQLLFTNPRQTSNNIDMESSNMKSISNSPKTITMSPSRIMKNINIYQDNEKLLSSFYNQIHSVKNNHLDQDESFKNKMKRSTAQFQQDEFNIINNTHYHDTDQNDIQQHQHINMQKDTTLNNTIEIDKSVITQ